MWEQVRIALSLSSSYCISYYCDSCRRREDWSVYRTWSNSEKATHSFQTGEPGIFSTETRVFRVTTRLPVAWMAFVSTFTQPTWQRTVRNSIRNYSSPPWPILSLLKIKVICTSSHRVVVQVGDGTRQDSISSLSYRHVAYLVNKLWLRFLSICRFIFICFDSIESSTSAIWSFPTSQSPLSASWLGNVSAATVIKK